MPKTIRSRIGALSGERRMRTSAVMPGATVLGSFNVSFDDQANIDTAASTWNPQPPREHNGRVNCSPGEIGSKFRRA
ncbi:MAG: hypothetical protein J4F48_10110, partial [Nitrospinae bacterium]|nr:hypothetical protein [Nitrospinota bacterium]